MKMKIVVAQLNNIVGDIQGNVDKVIQALSDKKAIETDLLVFSELFISGYPPEDLLHKDHFVQDNVKILRSLVKETADITAIIGFVDVDKNKKIYNAAAIVTNKKIKGVYRKEELPNYGVFEIGRAHV